MINEQLGVFWQINVLAGPGESIIDILVGARRSVLHYGMKKLEDIWAIELDSAAPLVIATIESDADQTWDQAIAALAVTERVATGDGAIVLVSRISSPPPGSRVLKQDATDRFGQRHVYLFSELSGEQAENAGFAPLADAAELARLVRQYGTATLLRDANKLDARLAR
jgi:hypothetical protein